VNTVREIPPESRKAAAELVRAWGFPRPIFWPEWRDSVWITDVPQTGIAWLQPGTEEGWYFLHAQLKPESGVDRSLRMPAGDVMAAIRTTAGLIGATRVYAALGGSRPGWRRWLMRSRWFDKEDELGPYMDLEG